ncbi:molybdenum cofactor guanylyltransferase [Chryseobacterium sp. SSA4.19]|uniref:molybdenum cofactor guanylyltransferase n=1 Tax=Chryseobacterium sp. SSA4.19 TaxID=2919915 RepID=UPI001F4EF62F|nr:molybdenum cofactor guanylyltransferase [Chryseobacterium sp. SSA4.19]MCJ8154560.1 molybdenum cofactor guanylyltransferase [Chryseobacterium sp. SSA4.19]
MKAVILAGGRSSRMGQNKAMMKLGEKMLIQYVIDAVSPVFYEVYISGNHSDYPISDGIIRDIILSKGPMGGIYSALEFFGEDIFVCSCDMPFVSSELIKNLHHRKEDGRINIAQCGNKMYPVLGIYPFSVLNNLKNAIESGNLKMTSFLKEQNAYYIPFNDEFENQFLNINTPENLRNAEVIMKNTL